jgi:hypothetical protein
MSNPRPASFNREAFENGRQVLRKGRKGSAMNKTPRGLSAFAASLGFLQHSPTKVKTHKAKKTSARILTKRSKSATPERSYTHRAAEIASGECACDAVRKVEGRRFLVNDVPPIPVPDCTSLNCKCSYIRYNDRRCWHADRRALFSLKADLHTIAGNEERRRKQGRRADDETTFAASDASFDLTQ